MNWIVLTGANGFIGHNLVCEFLDKKPQTLDFDIEHILGSDLQSSLKRSLHQEKSKFEDYDFCLADELVEKIRASTQTLGTKPLAVIHNGACSSTTETNPDVFKKLNLQSSQDLFQLCSELEIPFLYASSASVYGNGSQGFSDKLELNAQYKPLNLYGRSKHQFDSWVLGQTSKPPQWFGMRYFNVFGPFEEHKKHQASILHWGGKQIRETGKLRLYRSHRDDIVDGEQKRDFVSVFDVVRVTLGLLKLCQQKVDLSERGRFVNIGRGQATTWIEMGTALFQALQKPDQFEFIDMTAQLQEHYQNFTEADLSTLHSLGIDAPFLSHREAFERSLSSATV